MKKVALIINGTTTGYKQLIIDKFAQRIIKRQQPEVNGLGVASFTGCYGHMSTLFVRRQ
jgi:hypothetical protein